MNSSCGLSNGSVTTFPYGGTSPYSYVWSGGQITQTVTPLAAGIYTVTVTDFNGCTVVKSDTIFSSLNPSVVIDSVINVSCNLGNDGKIYITASGGTSPLSYLWSNTAVTPDITGLIAATYTVTVTDPFSCTSTVSATVTQPAVLNDSTQIIPEACNALNGSVIVFPYGGTSPYSYLWNTSATTQTITGLQSGTYTVTITDLMVVQKCKQLLYRYQELL